MTPSPAATEQQRIKLQLSLDAITLIVLIINLGWLLFDWLYTFDWFAFLFTWAWSNGHAWYGEHIHSHFYTIDLFFVAFFIGELLLSWGIAVKHKRFPKWYDYPFVHWYDVLGCIPVTGFRFLRLLRVVAILLRLQKLQWIDLRSWWITKTLQRPYRIIVEEISDRVVLNVLEGTKGELQQDDDLEHQIIQNVILPRSTAIADAIANRLTTMTTVTYQQHRQELAQFLSEAVHTAVETNDEIGTFAKIPVVGDTIKHQLDQAISDILISSLDQAIGQLDENLVKNMVATALQEWLQAQETNDLTELGHATAEILDIVKTQVAYKRWKSPIDA